MLFRSDRKSTRLNSSHTIISYAVFCLKKKKTTMRQNSKIAAELPRVKHYQDEHATAAHNYHPAGRSTAPLFLGCFFFFFFFFNDTGTPEIYPLSLHDALPINDTATTEIYSLSLHDAFPISVVAVSFSIRRRSLAGSAAGPRRGGVGAPGR